jgi:hypothetical protein
MESIAERHGALLTALAARKLADEAELANWDARHPAAAVRLGAALESAVEARGAATSRLSRARLRLDESVRELDPKRAADAFERSPKGLEWAARILAQANGRPAGPS